MWVLAMIYGSTSFFFIMKEPMIDIYHWFVRELSPEYIGLGALHVKEPIINIDTCI